MKKNDHILFLLLCLGILILSSCSPGRKFAKTEQKKTNRSQTEFQTKSADVDTLKRLDESEIVMPASVDISNYEPEYIRKEKKRKAKAKEFKLRQDMVDFGKKYLGVPYKYAGKKPSTGFDCSGLTCYIYQHFGLKLSPASRYQANDGKKIALKKAQPGDLIIFGTGGKVNHVAMVVEVKPDGIYVLHSTNRGVVIDNILESKYWKPRILYARKVIGE